MKSNRKLLLIGKYSHFVTLPHEWLKQLGWRAKQMLELELKKDTIVIRDFKN